MVLCYQCHFGICCHKGVVTVLKKNSRCYSFFLTKKKNTPNIVTSKIAMSLSATLRTMVAANPLELFNFLLLSFVC